MLCAQAGLQAGTITFAEYEGMSQNSAIPSDPPPSGLPEGVTATWSGFLLSTNPGDTPMSIFPAADIADADDAVITFSQPVVINSINIHDTSWGSPFSITGRLGELEIWKWVSPGDGPWTKV
ncbi:MAG: hypothetical protein D6766_02205, partial [Verrucomicrobia bacterium]